LLSRHLQRWNPQQHPLRFVLRETAALGGGDGKISEVSMAMGDPQKWMAGCWLVVEMYGVMMVNDG